jgi:hypothetical protein
LSFIQKGGIKKVDIIIDIYDAIFGIQLATTFAIGPTIGVTAVYSLFSKYDISVHYNTIV